MYRVIHSISNLGSARNKKPCCGFDRFCFKTANVTKSVNQMRKAHQGKSRLFIPYRNLHGRKAFNFKVMSFMFILIFYVLKRINKL